MTFTDVIFPFSTTGVTTAPTPVPDTIRLGGEVYSFPLF